jgi:hypothetical protein
LSKVPKDFEELNKREKERKIEVRGGLGKVDWAVGMEDSQEMKNVYSIRIFFLDGR